jgi:hypothetical protein
MPCLSYRSSIGILFVAGFLMELSGGVMAQAILQQNFGRFSHNPVVELLKNGRDVKLVQNFSYTDDKDRTWLVREGFVSDGASIPKPFWSYWSAVGRSLSQCRDHS